MTVPQAPEVRPASRQSVRTAARWLLAAFLGLAGVLHLISPRPFLAQVPTWMPSPQAVVLVSGLVEIALALTLLLPRISRVWAGWLVAAFFVLVFPGNIAQYLSHTDAFGLDSDLARGVRLLFQPVLVVWALWCTGAWSALRRRGQRQSDA